MRVSLALVLLPWLAIGSVGCVGTKTASGLYESKLPSHGTVVTKGSKRRLIAQPSAFFVGSRGWHSSITLERAAIPKGAWPAGVVEQTFAGSHYVEVGWGDADFYMARHPTVLTALDAALLPGASVLLVGGLDPPLGKALPWGGLQRVLCSQEEFFALCRAIGATFQRDKKGNAQAVGTGLYGRISRFYAAHGLYSAANTCNHWTVRMMRAGGLRASLAPTETWSSGAVVAQARRLVNKRAAAEIVPLPPNLKPAR